MLDYPPSTRSSGCSSILGQWQAFEEMLAAGEIKSLAVSNYSPAQLDCMINAKKAGTYKWLKTIPAVNQMPYGVYSQDPAMVKADHARGIWPQAYSPLSRGSASSDAKRKAVGAALSPKRSSAQVALRLVIQTKVTVCTSSLAHFKEDLDLFSWKISAAGMTKLSSLNGMGR